MKNFLLTALTFLCFKAHSQESSQYVAYKTQLYMSSRTEKEWTPVDEPNYVQIVITVKNNYIVINSKSPTSYTIYNESKENIKGEGFTGIRYRALEHADDTPCYISIVNYTEESYAAIHVSYMDQDPQFLLVYYLKKTKK